MKLIEVINAAFSVFISGLLIVAICPLLGSPRFQDDPMHYLTYYLTAWSTGTVIVCVWRWLDNRR